MPGYKLRTLLTQFSLRDLFWLILISATISYSYRVWNASETRLATLTSEVHAERARLRASELDLERRQSVFEIRQNEFLDMVMQREQLRSDTLTISWLAKDNRTARYFVDRGGLCSVHDGYRSASSYRRLLSPSDLKLLSELLLKLPESKEDIPSERVVHLHFHADDAWRTLNYDAESLPDEFKKITLLIGQQF